MFGWIQQGSGSRKVSAQATMRARQARRWRGRQRISSLEQLEPLVMLDGEAVVEIVSPPSNVVENERIDIQVRYKMTESDGGPFLVEELSIRDSDPAGIYNRIARTDGQRFAQQNTWYYYTFRNVRLSDFDDGGNGVELYAHVDIDNQAAFFADATDNSPVYQVTIRPGVPDLIVKSLRASDTSVDPGDKVDIDAVVQNIGNGDASQSLIHYYFGPNRGSRSLEVGTGLMPNLGVLSPMEEEGDMINNFTIPAWPDGHYYITAVADSGSAVRESDENNNQAYVRITIGTPGPEPPDPVPVASLVCGPPTGPGVTIVTHGFQLAGGPDSRTPDWTMEMAEAILERNGSSGSILVHDPNLNRWVPPESRGLPVSWNNSNDLDDEIVLVYDWSWESNDFQKGWLEAAADSLFTNLVAPFGFTSEKYHNLLTRPMHFIGHSRGTVVNSLAASRLNYYFPELQISQFTTLDPHPSTIHRDPGYDADPPELRIPDNVLWADNYYRKDGAYELDNDFNGVEAIGAFNLQLNEDVLQGAGHLQEHSDAHLWYLATIKDDASEVEGYSLDDDGFDDWWTSGQGYAAEDEDASGRPNVGFARSRLGGSTLRTDQMNRNQLQSAVKPALVFNGDFELGAELTNEIPGWERHGGGGTGNLDGGGNNYLQLNDNDSFRIHNPMFIPPSVSNIQFDYWIHDNDGLNSNDKLEVLLGDEVLGEGISLAWETDGFVRGFRLPLSATQVDSINSLQFRIGGSGDIQSGVRIDNVTFVEDRPTRSIQLDEIHAAIVSGSGDGMFDLNHDGFIDVSDGSHFLRSCRVYRGDSNRDGQFESDDIVLTFQAGLFETGSPATWEGGDWNFDGVFNTADFVAALQEGRYNQQDRVASTGSATPPRNQDPLPTKQTLFAEEHRRLVDLAIADLDNQAGDAWDHEENAPSSLPLGHPFVA